MLLCSQLLGPETLNPVTSQRSESSGARAAKVLPEPRWTPELHPLGDASVQRGWIWPIAGGTSIGSGLETKPLPPHHRPALLLPPLPGLASPPTLCGQGQDRRRDATSPWPCHSSGSATGIVPIGRWPGGEQEFGMTPPRLNHCLLSLCRTQREGNLSSRRCPRPVPAAPHPAPGHGLCRAVLRSPRPAALSLQWLCRGVPAVGSLPWRCQGPSPPRDSVSRWEWPACPAGSRSCVNPLLAATDQTHSSSLGAL